LPSSEGSYYALFAASDTAYREPPVCRSSTLSSRREADDAIMAVALPDRFSVLCVLSTTSNSGVPCPQRDSISH